MEVALRCPRREHSLSAACPPSVFGDSFLKDSEGAPPRAFSPEDAETAPRIDASVTFVGFGSDTLSLCVGTTAGFVVWKLEPLRCAFTCVCGPVTLVEALLSHGLVAAVGGSETVARPSGSFHQTLVLGKALQRHDEVSCRKRASPLPFRKQRGKHEQSATGASVHLRKRCCCRRFSPLWTAGVWPWKRLCAFSEEEFRFALGSSGCASDAAAPRAVFFGGGGRLRRAVAVSH